MRQAINEHPYGEGLKTNDTGKGARCRMENEFRPVKVRNRDIPLLSSVLYIMQEIKGLEERRLWQRERMLNITQHITGMPGGGGRPKGLEDAISLLSEIDERHEEKCREYARQLKKAQKILNGIESVTMRTFVEMKYVMDVPDVKIRSELNMSYRGFDRARKAVESASSMASVVWREKYIVEQDGNSTWTEGLRD